MTVGGVVHWGIAGEFNLFPLDHKRHGEDRTVTSAAVWHREETLDGPLFLTVDSRDNDATLTSLRNNGFRVEALSSPFALAIANPRERSLLLARDVSGERSLFVHEGAGRVAISAMPGDLTHFTSREVDLQFLADSLAGTRLSPGPSCWKGIRAVLPGTAELHRPGGFQRRSIVEWDVMTRPLADDDADTLRLLLDRTVDAAFNDVPRAAVQLSSGLDSNAVLASAARDNAESLLAITAGPGRNLPVAAGRHRFGDETGLASRAAEAAGVRHVILSDESRIIPTLRGSSVHFHGPVPNPVNLGWMRGLAMRAASEGATHMITAIQGNATLTFGGLWILPEWLRRGQVRAWLRQVVGARNLPDVRWQGLIYNSVEPWLPPGLPGRILGTGRGGAMPSRSSFLRPEWRPSENATAPVAMNDVRRWMIANYDQGQNNRAFASMTGLNYRDPTADRALLDFCLSLPPEAFLDRGVAKPLFKRAMANRIPSFILYEPLRGFQGADYYGRINQVEAHEAIEELASNHDVSELLDFAAMRHAVDQWPAFDPTRAPEMFAFIRCLTDALATGYFLLEKGRIGGHG